MPARSSGATAARLRGAERVLALERGREREPKRLMPPRGTPREQVSELQRVRLLAAAVAVFDELGYARASVAHITARARVSRRTFYDLFSNREECLGAVVEEAVGLIAGELAAANLGGLAWRERVRVGLWTILSFFDREPALARVCVVQALRCGPEVLARRDEILAGVAAVVDEGRLESARGEQCTPLTAEGVVGAAFAIVYARLLRGEREPLTGLLGELMGMIVLPYRGAAAARRELTRPAPAGRVRATAAPSKGERAVDDPLQGVSIRLTYRTVRVLEGVSRRPGASNRQVAERAGIQDPGQISETCWRVWSVWVCSPTRARGTPKASRMPGA